MRVRLFPIAVAVLLVAAATVVLIGRTGATLAADAPVLRVGVYENPPKI